MPNRDRRALSFAVAMLLLPAVCRATDVRFVGSLGYQQFGTTVVMTAERIENFSTNTTSGSLRLELWALANPFGGQGSASGYQLATYDLGQLQPRYYYSNVSSGSVAIRNPPDGTWYYTMFLDEWDGSRWVWDSYGNLVPPVVCSSGICRNEDLPTPTRTQRPSPTTRWTATPTPTPAPPTPPAGALCVGDCNGGDSVTVDEIITLVNVVLGTVSPSACRAGVAGDVDIAAIVGAVTNLLTGCGGLRGHVEVLWTFRIPGDDRSTVLAQRSALEANGLVVAADGSAISTDPVPGIGWYVRAGSALALTDASGNFALEPPSGETTLAIFNPSDHDHAVGAITTAELARNGGTITVSIISDGPCGMNAGDENEPPTCHSLSERRAADDAVEQSAEEQLLTSMPCDSSLGTCPSGDQSSCEDQNGWLCREPSPLDCAHSFLNYPGSTCFLKVNEGCCTYERAHAYTIAGVTIQLPPPNPRRCVETHRGRFCQELAKGDLNIRAPRANASTPIKVRPGEQVSFTVHNNGCFGETVVETRPTSNRLGGTLSAASLGSIGSRIEILRHYDAGLNYAQRSAYGQYSPDLQITYTAPSSCVAGQSDAYSFSADGTTRELAVECEQATRTPGPQATPTVDGCDGGRGGSGTPCDSSSQCCNSLICDTGHCSTPSCNSDPCLNPQYCLAANTANRCCAPGYYFFWPDNSCRREDPRDPPSGGCPNPGDVACTCPGTHSCIGYWCNGTKYHAEGLYCSEFRCE